MPITNNPEVSLSILITKIIFLIVTFICVEKYIEWFDLKKIRQFKLSISKKFLKNNGKESLYDSIIQVSSNDANSVALGMQLVYDNFDCEPNGSVIEDVINYLKQK